MSLYQVRSDPVNALRYKQSCNRCLLKIIMEPLYTIGHSNRSLEAFVGLLQTAGIRTLVDVRQQPQSSRHPQFGQDNLRTALAEKGIEYHWAGRQLGGHRTPRTDSVHTALADDSMRGYADYMESEAFKKGITQLINLAGRASTAIMCAERDPRHCHRSLIADYLTLQGVDVIHLLDTEPQPHQLRAEVRRESQQLVYDRFATAELPLD